MNIKLVRDENINYSSCRQFVDLVMLPRMEEPEEYKMEMLKDEMVHLSTKCVEKETSNIKTIIFILSL